MEFAPFDPLIASNAELVTWCKNARFIHGGEGFNGLVRPSRAVAIKIGGSVTEDEARNQDYAYKHLKGPELRAPRVYRYFSDGEGPCWKGYLMMEYIPGKTMEIHMAEERIEGVQRLYAKQLFEAAQEVARIPVPLKQAPGPFGGGSPCGYLFGVSCTAVFQSLQEMNDYLNKRLIEAQDPMSKVHKIVNVPEQAKIGTVVLKGPLTFIHGDLCPRNFLIKDDGSRVLVDWASAGFYPKPCEAFAILAGSPRDPVLWEVYKLLLGTDEISHTMWKLRCIQNVNFHFPRLFDR